MRVWASILLESAVVCYAAGQQCADQSRRVILCHDILSYILRGDLDRDLPLHERENSPKSWVAESATNGALNFLNQTSTPEVARFEFPDVWGLSCEPENGR